MQQCVYYISLLGSICTHLLLMLIFVGVPSGTSQDIRDIGVNATTIAIRMTPPPKKVLPKKLKVTPKPNPVRKTEPVTGSAPIQKIQQEVTSEPVEKTISKEEIIREDGIEEGVVDSEAALEQQQAQEQLGLRLAYRDTLRIHVERYKRYPRAAIKQHLTGEALVSFTLNSDGTVVNVAITKSSGHAIIDRAVLQTIRAASPFPKAPDYYKGSLHFRVPVSFGIR